MPNDHVPHPPSTENDRNEEVIYIRLPSALRARVDAHRVAMQASSQVGVVVSRAAAIRNLLELGLQGAA